MFFEMLNINFHGISSINIFFLKYLNALIIMPSFTFFVGNHRYVNHLKDTGPFDLKTDEKKCK